VSGTRTNDDVARVLLRLAELSKFEDANPQSFRARAYERAATAIRSSPRDVTGHDLDELRAIAGVGDGTARKIAEYLGTGRIGKLDRLRAAYPPEFVELTRIPGIGPKTAIMFRERLGVESVDQLRSAIDDERLRELPGFGPQSEEKIGVAIERLGLHGKDRRTPIGDALPVAMDIVGRLSKHPAVDAIRYCGSLRRFRETIGDVDILVSSDRPEEVAAAFVNLPLVSDVPAHGVTKLAIVTHEGLQVDLRTVPAESFGAATLYFTGSKAHNIALRRRAIEHGLQLNEYALIDTGTAEPVASRTEIEIYETLGLPFIPSTMREGRGEIEAADAGTLPVPVRVEDLRGDLHVHSTWSGDGRSSLAEMVAAVAERGLDYVAITDHAEDLVINGLSREEVLAERAEIDALRRVHSDVTILHGAELNIGPRGGVDYDDEFLSGFDWCVASVHSHFDLPAEVQTGRIVRAMEHPSVNAIGHLTGRRIGRRPGIEFDLDTVFAAALRTGTALEINSHLDRLDVPADMLFLARDLKDLVFVISTDAHHTTELDNARWGVMNAARGWVDSARVVNTWSTTRFLDWSQSKK
jgi:DNA polymerase (family 10)